MLIECGAQWQADGYVINGRNTEEKNDSLPPLYNFVHIAFLISNFIFINPVYSLRLSSNARFTMKTLPIKSAI